MRRPIVVCTALSLAALSLAPGVVSGQSPAGGWDPSSVTGSVRLTGWASSPAETAALEATIAPYRNTKGRHWQDSEPSLEDVFIDLMTRSKDNFQ